MNTSTIDMQAVEKTKEKTAIQFLIDYINESGCLKDLNFIQIKEFDEKLKQCLAIEKEQIISAFWADLNPNGRTSANEYYSDTYE